MIFGRLRSFAKNRHFSPIGLKMIIIRHLGLKMANLMIFGRLRSFAKNRHFSPIGLRVIFELKIENFQSGFFHSKMIKIRHLGLKMPKTMIICCLRSFANIRNFSPIGLRVIFELKIENFQSGFFHSKMIKIRHLGLKIANTMIFG